MDNLKDLSFDELIKLQKILNDEIEDRKVHKSDIGCQRMHGQFLRDWYNKGLLRDERHKNINAFYSAIYKICDFTLENYKLINSPGHGSSSKQIQVNGKRIDISNPDDYTDMANDIFDVIIKYYEKTHKCKMTEMSEEEELKILGEEEMDARC